MVGPWERGAAGTSKPERWAYKEQDPTADSSTQTGRWAMLPTRPGHSLSSPSHFFSPLSLCHWDSVDCPPLVSLLG